MNNTPCLILTFIDTAIPSHPYPISAPRDPAARIATVAPLLAPNACARAESLGLDKALTAPEWPTPAPVQLIESTPV